MDGILVSILQNQGDVKKRGKGQKLLIPIEEYCKKDS
jgi:hypothetical protein